MAALGTRPWPRRGGLAWPGPPRPVPTVQVRARGPAEPARGDACRGRGTARAPPPRQSNWCAARQARRARLRRARR
eukprot:2644180-Lingulodinium_polyedra.AAC.1